MMKFTIDRIDNGIAVLIARDATLFRVTIPALLLPHGCHEGDSITLSLERDKEATIAARARVTDLLETLKKKQ
jgi:hypothetical protein